MTRRPVRSRLPMRRSSRGFCTATRPSSMRVMRSSSRCGSRATVPATDDGLLRERLHDVAALLAEQLRGVGLDGIPDVERGVERAAHARGQRHRADDEQEVLGQLERQRAHDVAELDRERRGTRADRPPAARRSPCRRSARTAAVIARSSSAVSADGSSTPTSRMPSTMPLPSRDAAAMSSARRPCAQPRRHLAHHPEVDEGELPGAVRAGSPFRRAVQGVTKMLPGCGSAWKKPCGEELVEHDGREVDARPRRGRCRRPAARRGR